jgi:hypothetical protein
MKFHNGFAIKKTSILAINKIYVKCLQKYMKNNGGCIMKIFTKWLQRLVLVDLNGKVII